MKDRLLVAGFLGVGDTFYQRPIIRQLVANNPDKIVTLSTSYPDLYWDMPELEFWYRPTVLRCQDKAQRETPKEYWAPVHKRTTPDMSLSYNANQFQRGLTILESFEEIVPLKVKLDMSFPLQNRWIEEARKIIGKEKVCILRRPTLRAEWRAPARNPKPEYIQLVVDEAKRMGFKIISVGFVQSELEIFDGDVKGIDVYFEKGELPIHIIAALHREAALTIGTQGNVIPMTLAVGAKCFSVWGGYVGPQLCFDKRLDLSKQQAICPKPFCNCLDMSHPCYKEIDRDYLLSQFRDFASMESREGSGVLSSRPIPSRATKSLRPSILPEVSGVRSDPDGEGFDCGTLGDSESALQRIGGGYRDRVRTVSRGEEQVSGDGGVRRESDSDSVAKGTEPVDGPLRD